MTATLRAGTARIGLLGAGGIGRAHAEAVASLGAVGVLAGVADINPEIAASVAGASESDVVTMAELADRDRFDLVVVASPPASHLAVVEPLLAAGVPVLCEKPLAVDLASARALASAAGRTGTPLTMATKFRFVEDVVATRELIASGALGQVIKVEVAFAGRANMTDKWNAVREIAGGGVLIDNATHGIDLAQHLVGPLVSVLAVEGPSGQPLDVEDSATLLGRTGDGVLVEVDVTWSFRRLSPVYCAAHGTRGTVEIAWQGSQKLVEPDTEPVAFGSGYRKIDSLRANLAAVIAALAANEKPPVGVDEAVSVAAVVDAGYRSARTGTWTSVEVAK